MDDWNVFAKGISRLLSTSGLRHVYTPTSSVLVWTRGDGPASPCSSLYLREPRFEKRRASWTGKEQKPRFPALLDLRVDKHTRLRVLLSEKAGAAQDHETRHVVRQNHARHQHAPARGKGFFFFFSPFFLLLVFPFILSFQFSSCALSQHLNKTLLLLRENGVFFSSFLPKNAARARDVEEAVGARRDPEPDFFLSSRVTK